MRSYLNLCVMFGLLLSHAPLHAQVRVWEGTLTLPTYEEGAPDPNPPFDQFRTTRFSYPYTLREDLTGKSVAHNWRAVYLENEYLKCSVLPDIGGHLYTCIDKLSGQSMFYNNSSIKKADVGYRGAWAAFGIEFNFPVSHNWVSMSPVNYAFRQNQDGSGSVFVSNIDRVYGMEWQVELRLRPKSTLLEERVTLSNRSDVRHRFYWWNNAAIRVNDDSHIVYPMRYVASHGFTEVLPWPMDSDGHDLSVIRNHVHGAVSYFVYGSREDFMGVWHPETKTGTVHFAQYDQLPAKKIWSWGVDEEGLDWRKALSDDNSGYVEVQAGLFRNQETYAFLEPRESIHFSEYWMPVRQLDGISRANLAGVVSLSRQGGHLVAEFNANTSIPHAAITISQATRKLFSETCDLTPEHTWSHTVVLSDAQARASIVITNAEGKVLLQQTEGEYDWTPEAEIKVGPQSSYPIPAPGHRTSDDWVQLGRNLELNGNVLQALDTYKEAVRRFPNDFAALKSAGRLAAALLRFEEAKDLLEQVKARDTSDPEISYYLGLAFDGLGEQRKARGSYEEAERVGPFRAAAALRLGELLARQGNLVEAENHLQQGHASAPGDLRLIEELTAVKAASGKTQDASQLAQQGLAVSPTSYLLSELAGNADLRQLGNDSERVLNLAAEYMRLGFYEQALTILSRDYSSAPSDQSEPGSLPPAKHPMVAYFRGYCRERLGQSPLEDYKAASQLPTSYVFPNTAEELTVLRAAVSANPQDALAHYLLGTLYFSQGLTDVAVAEWSRARELDSRIRVLDASLGLALLHEKRDAAKALTVFRDGFASDPENVTLYLGADQALSMLASNPRERVDVLSKFPDLQNAPTGLIFELILNLAEAGDFSRAEALFRNRFFPREEGGTNVRQVWVEVQLRKSLALAHLKQCDAALSALNHLGEQAPDLAFTQDGLEPFVDAAGPQYLAGTIYADCGAQEKAQAKFQLAAKAEAPDQAIWAWKAAQKLPDFDGRKWQARLQSALTQAEGRTETSSFASWWYYTAGALSAALGKQEASKDFSQALLLPDKMLAYHYTRLAQNEASQ